MRDGVSLSRHTRQTPLILPAEFSQLKDLECYLKFPGDYPCTKLQTRYKKALLAKREAFLLKPETKHSDITIYKEISYLKESSSQKEIIDEEKES